MKRFIATLLFTAILSQSALMNIYAAGESSVAVEATNIDEADMEEEISDDEIIEVEYPTSPLLVATSSSNYEEAVEDLENGLEVNAADLINADAEPVAVANASESSGRDNEYLYSVINSYEQQIYNAIINNIDTFKTGTDVSVSGLSGSFNTSNALLAIYHDHPEYFWFNINNMKYSQSGTTVTVSFSNAFTADEISSYETQLESAVSTIISDNNLESLDRYNQIIAINKYLVLNNAYNSDAADGTTTYDDKKMPWNLLSALLSDTASPVCEGYAEAFEYICHKLGIPCVTVVSETHMWDRVQMEDGSWYDVDPTWNDPVVSSSSSITDDVKYNVYGLNYMLLGSAVMTSQSGSSSMSKFREFSDHQEEYYLETPPASQYGYYY